MAWNKTDANDADGLAHLAEAAFYREIRVKGYDSTPKSGASEEMPSDGFALSDRWCPSRPICNASIRMFFMRRSLLATSFARAAAPV